MWRGAFEAEEWVRGAGPAKCARLLSGPDQHTEPTVSGGCGLLRVGFCIWKGNSASRRVLLGIIISRNASGAWYGSRHAAR